MYFLVNSQRLRKNETEELLGWPYKFIQRLLKRVLKNVTIEIDDRFDLFEKCKVCE